jgi:RHS repeat-associated protein
MDYLNGLAIDNKLRQKSISTGSLYFLPDHLGSTAALTNNVGNLVELSQYEAFGETQGSALTRYGYTGREREAATMLMYYRARFYNSQTGRFISEDPIGFAGGPNLYSYVRNNPIAYFDPLGLSTCPSNDCTGLTPELTNSLNQFEQCTGLDITVTCGTGGHAPGDPHSSGQAIDIGRNSNPNLDLTTFQNCYSTSFSTSTSYAQEEQNCGPGTHFHLQTRPGRNGSTGFNPVIQPNRSCQ